MSTTVEQLAEQAMNLSAESRAQLADLLVESLDSDELGRIELMWVVEAKPGAMKFAPARSSQFLVRRRSSRYEIL
jgi:hypothetical protein